jgi:hypothetical protein
MTQVSPRKVSDNPIKFAEFRRHREAPWFWLAMAGGAVVTHAIALGAVLPFVARASMDNIEPPMIELVELPPASIADGKAETALPPAPATASAQSSNIPTAPSDTNSVQLGSMAPSPAPSALPQPPQMGFIPPDPITPIAPPNSVAPTSATPGQPLPGQPLPGQPLPGQPLPGQPLPGQPLPGQQLGSPSFNRIDRTPMDADGHVPPPPGSSTVPSNIPATAVNAVPKPVKLMARVQVFTPKAENTAPSAVAPSSDPLTNPLTDPLTNPSNSSTNQPVAPGAPADLPTTVAEPPVTTLNQAQLPSPEAEQSEIDTNPATSTCLFVADDVRSYLNTPVAMQLVVNRNGRVAANSIAMRQSPENPEQAAYYSLAKCAIAKRQFRPATDAMGQPVDSAPVLVQVSITTAP